MKNFLYPVILLTIIFVASYSYAKKDNSLNTETEICNIIQNTYIKEVNIVYNLKEIIKQCKNYTNILKFLKIHQENINSLKNIMEQYSLKIPVVNIPRNNQNRNCNLICKEIIQIEKDLLKLYNESLVFLHTVPKNETIGLIIEKFEKIKKTLENDGDYSTINNDI